MLLKADLLSSKFRNGFLGPSVEINSQWKGLLDVPKTLSILVMAGHADSQGIGGAGTAGATRQGRAQPTSKSIIRDAISMHESLGTDEIILRPVTANPEQIDRLADAIS